MRFKAAGRPLPAELPICKTVLKPIAKWIGQRGRGNTLADTNIIQNPNVFCPRRSLHGAETDVDGLSLEGFEGCASLDPVVSVICRCKCGDGIPGDAVIGCGFHG